MVEVGLSSVGSLKECFDERADVFGIISAKDDPTSIARERGFDPAYDVL